MTQIVQHIAYGMNGGSIPKLTNKQLIAAFFRAADNLPSIDPQYKKPIEDNMAKIADEMSERVDAAKGGHKIKLEVHLDVMRVMVKTIWSKRF